MALVPSQFGLVPLKKINAIRPSVALMPCGLVVCVLIVNTALTPPASIEKIRLLMTLWILIGQLISDGSDSSLA